MNPLISVTKLQLKRLKTIVYTFVVYVRKPTNYAKVVLRRRQEQGMRALSVRSLLVVNDWCLR